MNYDCKCGAYTCSAAAYRQLSHAEKIEHLKNVRECGTCRVDRTRDLRRHSA